jgi:hypothetical protein
LQIQYDSFRLGYIYFSCSCNCLFGSFFLYLL